MYLDSKVAQVDRQPLAENEIFFFPCFQQQLVLPLDMITRPSQKLDSQAAQYISSTYLGIIVGIRENLGRVEINSQYLTLPKWIAVVAFVDWEQP